MSGPSPIGGFFETHESGVGEGPTVLEAWTAGRPWSAFVNARSAIAALARQRPHARVWLPDYICVDAARGLPPERVRLYPLDEAFRPDLGGVESRAGDLVVLVCYFGQPVDEATRRFAVDRPDLVFVEDRAHALDAGEGIAGAWRLFSPRKLFGVADGGLLVAPEGQAPPRPDPRLRGEAGLFWHAPDLRADPESDSMLWHDANQARERAMRVADQGVTLRSEERLRATPISTLVQPRQANWARLHHCLAAWSAMNAAAPPLGYVLDLPPGRRDEVLAGLHAERIFAAVHWREVLGEDRHNWSRRLITLPCDHRYGEAKMDRVAEIAMRLLA